MDSFIQSCVASDVIQVQLVSTGVVHLVPQPQPGNAAVVTERDIQDLVTRDNLQDAMESLCDSILRFEVTIRPANRTNTTTIERLSDGRQEDNNWGNRVASAVCDLTDEKLSLSVSMIAVLVVAALIVICAVVCASCCSGGCRGRRNKR